jgi:hypothetical protein
VGFEIIPDKDHPAPDVTKEMADKDFELLRGYGSFTDKDKEAAVGGNARYGRQFGPRGSVKNDGCLTFGSPGFDACRNQPKTGLIGEDDGGLEFAGFFLMRGHSLLTHWLMAASFLSLARVAGF